uniref:GPI transamidase component PIG-S n=1 Tax=Rhizophora mucronata TaxID=61149 RepID=A0A2P2KZT7_RHIMU
MDGKRHPLPTILLALRTRQMHHRLQEKHCFGLILPLQVKILPAFLSCP